MIQVSGGCPRRRAGGDVLQVADTWVPSPLPGVGIRAVGDCLVLNPYNLLEQRLGWVSLARIRQLPLDDLLQSLQSTAMGCAVIAAAVVLAPVFPGSLGLRDPVLQRGVEVQGLALRGPLLLQRQAAVLRGG